VVRADKLGRDRIDPVYKAIPAISPFGRILYSALSTLFMVLPTCSAAEAQELGVVASGLLQAVLDGQIHREDLQQKFAAARARALQVYVAANALDDTLTVDTLSSTFNASRATVYRAFEEFGGIHRYIARIRLLRSFARLSTAEASRGLVGNVAYACGYQDLAHFSRAFKREFGFSPSDIVGLRNAEGQDMAALQTQEQSSRLTPMIRLYG
ncbi:MAG: AraC family transcriptional regulator, partial [Pseudomonadota bacterium]